MHPAKARPGGKMELTCQSAHRYYSCRSHRPCAAPQRRGAVAAWQSALPPGPDRRRSTRVNAKATERGGIVSRHSRGNERHSRRRHRSIFSRGAGRSRRRRLWGRSSAVLLLGAGRVPQPCTRARDLMPPPRVDFPNTGVLCLTAARQTTPAGHTVCVGDP